MTKDPLLRDQSARTFLLFPECDPEVGSELSILCINKPRTTYRKSLVFFSKSFKTACFSRRISSRSCAYAERRGDERSSTSRVYI